MVILLKHHDLSLVCYTKLRNPSGFMLCIFNTLFDSGVALFSPSHSFEEQDYFLDYEDWIATSGHAF